MCSGSSVCGKKVRSGSGKIGTSALATDGSADGGELEGGDGVETLDDAAGQSQEGRGLCGGGLADHDGNARVAALARLISRGMRVRTGPPHSSATRSPPPSPKMAYSPPVSGATK